MERLECSRRAAGASVRCETTGTRPPRRIALGLVAAAWCLPVRVDAQLRGDSTAVAAVDRMLEAVGGRRPWAEGRTLHLVYRAWLTQPRAQMITERAWRDLWEPNQRIELHGDSVSVTSVMTAEGGWRTRNGRRAENAELLVRDRVYWWRDYYTLFHRFAVRDPDLSITTAGENRVVVHSDRQGEIGWFEIASDGAPVRWGTLDGGEPLVYVYGPLRDFGRIRFPAWGANLDGTWRFEYAAVSLTPDPIASALLAPPGP